MLASDNPKSRILVVDDDESLQRVLTLALEREHFEVVCAGDGLDAIEKLRAQPYDLVLLDLKMPRMTGFEVLKTLRAEGMATRVIVMTADDTQEALLQVFKDQVYDYLNKPFHTTSLIEVAKRALAAPSDSLAIEVVSARPEWVELLVPCTLDAADRVHNFIQRLDAHLPEDIRESMGQAFRELLHNAIEWGGKLNPASKVRISCIRSRRMLLYRIADPGEGFTFEGLAHSAVSNPAGSPIEHSLTRERKGLRPGGFGIFLVRQMVDELLYNEKRNEVVFVKYLS